MGVLEGKTAVVTGGSTGIGLATARRFAAEGAHVFVTGRREAELARAVELIGDATGVTGDVSVEADVRRLYEQVRARGRGLDVVFANVGINRAATLEDFTQEQHDRIFAVNVRGVVLTVHHALPLLGAGSSVVLATSTAADNGAAGLGDYGASKAALRAYLKIWTNELIGRGIRVNAVSPGPTDSPMFEDVFGDRADEMRTAVGAGLPVGRLGKPAETAAVVTFLASPESGFMHGSEVLVDGGELAS